MKRHLAFVLTLPALALAAACPASAESWIFRPSTYSHNPATGERVIQYRPEKTAYARVDPTYMESGYRHEHVAFRGADGSYDHTHVVQTWGAGDLIRPYGEWQYPYRAGATPYGPWGNPQGPWTTPFQSWVNPYGLGKLPNPPWPNSPYYSPSPSAPPAPPSGGYLPYDSYRPAPGPTTPTPPPPQPRP